METYVEIIKTIVNNSSIGEGEKNEIHTNLDIILDEYRRLNYDIYSSEKKHKSEKTALEEYIDSVEDFTRKVY